MFLLCPYIHESMIRDAFPSYTSSRTLDWVCPPTISSQLACFILCTLLRWYVRKSGYYSMWPHQLLSLAFFSFFPKIVWNYSRWIIIKIIDLLIYHGQGTCKSAWLKINHGDYLKYRHTSLYSAILYRVSQILWPFFILKQIEGL